MTCNNIGIIGDVHCEDQLLRKAIEILVAKKSDVIICTGDIADGNGDFNKCVRLLKKHNVKTIRGNHDNWFLADLMRSLPNATQVDNVNTCSIQYLKTLPKTMSFQSPLGEVLLCHGLGENDMARFTPDDYGYAIEVNNDLQKIISDSRYSVVIGGHTHKRMVRKLGKSLFINAGSLIKSYDPCISFADFHKKYIEFSLFDESGYISNKEIIEFIQ